MVTPDLPDIPVFSGLDPNQIEELSSWLKRVERPADTEVFPEGALSDGLYILARGRVAVTKRAGSAILTLAELEGPSVFGEMGLLAHERRSAGIRTITKIVAGLLPVELFETRLAENNITALRVAYNLGRISSLRLRVAIQKILELSDPLVRQQIFKTGREGTSEDLSDFCKQYLTGGTF